MHYSIFVSTALFLGILNVGCGDDAATAECTPIAKPAMFAGHDWNAVSGYKGWILGFPDSEVVPGDACWTAHQAWITATQYTAEIRAGLEAQNYVFAGQEPMEDFIAKLQSVSYVVTNTATSEKKTFAFNDPMTIAIRGKLGDYRNDVPGEEANPIILFYASLPPLAPGAYHVEVHFVLSAIHNDGYALEPDNFLPSGDSLGREFDFTVAE